MPTLHKCASNTTEAFWTLDPFSIVAPGDPWHADLEAHLPREHYGLVAKVSRRLAPSNTRPEFVHVGIVGHGGTGKTTLLRTTMHALQGQGLHPVFIDAVTSFDQVEMSFADLILVCTRAVLEELQRIKARLPKAESELLKLWFAEELLTEEHRKELLGSVESEAGASLTVPFLAKLMGKVTAVLKSDNVYRTELRRRAERDPADLVRRANALLDAAAKSLSKKMKEPREIVVVFDNLEKLADPKVDSEVLRRAGDLRRLRCHLVMFLHPRHQYTPITTQASQAFDVLSVPMLPVREQGDGPDVVATAAVDAVRLLLSKRLNLERVLVPAEECVREITRLSSGRLRDVLHLTRAACERADPDPVTPDHVEAAARKLAGERATLARAEHWPRLAEIHRDRQVFGDATDSHLLLHSLVLNYDDAPWWDVHPLVRRDKRFQEQWQQLSPIAKPGPA